MELEFQKLPFVKKFQIYMQVLNVKFLNFYIKD